MKPHASPTIRNPRMKLNMGGGGESGDGVFGVVSMMGDVDGGWGNGLYEL